ncbi:hypothetical protein [Pedobacter metabolipauper]|uniref:Uncharacterized protein n=1 Tax=Pedobacter metabolipauper TaxID=425513 RepID=A0A4R6T2S4_9SPHI|nr:hypothetical protein [Pedobacter metabolipauper]TDQ12028.1 hypothetical protein ATK78_1159 [Pedobacter metabolipauper]
MKVKCLYKTGLDLRPYDSKLLSNEQFGRFGASGNSIYGEITVGQEYLVMGIVVFETYQGYLLDEGLISVCPCLLFEVTDEKVNVNWHSRIIGKDEGIYPYIQMVIGYPEFCSDKLAYDKLIVEKEEEAERIYFKRKIELEQE